MPFSTETLMDLYRQMRRIRTFEEKLAELVNAGQLAGFLHLYAGQEAVAVGVCAHLGDGDYVASTHRGHGHAIAKGVDLRAMMAELFGRRTGVCKGKGGSMHIADLERGMLGANGIVGAGIPLTVGPALLECKTYRYYGHYVGDPLTYRTKEEAETWRQRDPLAGFAERTVREGLVEPGNLHRIDAEVAAEVEEAVRAAREAPEPEPADVATDVYVNG